ncbi:MAG: class II aldolase/adducin family protein [Rhodospirillales bacterium]
MHKARPDVIAAAHAHSTYGKAWSVFGRPLDPLTQDSLFFFEDQAIYTEYGGVVVTTEEGDKIATALGRNSTGDIAKSWPSDRRWFGGGGGVALYRVRGLRPRAVAGRTDGPPAASRIAGNRPLHARPGAARRQGRRWFSFQPLWDLITREQPDLFD